MSTHLDTKTLAARLGIVPQTARQWRMKGTGPRFLRTGTSLSRGRCLYALADVEAWEESRKASSTSEESVRAARPAEAVRP